MIDMAKNEGFQAIEAAASLIPDCLEGNARARETLARWCFPKVHKTVILTYGRGPDADDLTQIAIAKVFDRLSSYRGDAGFYTWVDRITINVLRDFFRSKKTKKRWEVTDSDLCETEGGEYPDKDLERQRLLICLSDHLCTIKLDRRLPLVLVLGHGYTVAEVAKMLEISVEAAKKRVQRGRTELLGILRKDSSFMEMFKEVTK